MTVHIYSYGGYTCNIKFSFLHKLFSFYIYTYAYKICLNSHTYFSLNNLIQLIKKIGKTISLTFI